ncbi:MAG: leucine-rich repeat domain-containing protein [Planctomycetota bacterium]
MKQEEALKLIEQAATDGWTELDLTGKNLTAVPGEIGELKSLTELWLRDNNLTALPAEISQLKNLTDLVLSNNNLASVPAEVWQLKNLTMLDLGGNNLTSISTEIGQLKNLTRLWLHDNNLTTLPAEISQLKNLTDLVLSNNNLAPVPAEVWQLKNLTMLDLDRNNLTSVPSEIGQLKNLTRLDLSSNNLTCVPAEIGQLHNLTRLDLYNNSLTSLPAEIGQLEMLERLYLHGNNELGIPPEVLGPESYEVAPEWVEIAQGPEPARPADIIEYYSSQRREAKVLPIGQGRVDMEGFDVFLCHNNEDKAAVKKIAKELKGRGIRVWLDEWELRPGLPWQRALEEQIQQIKSAAVFVGDSGIGPWQEVEIEAFLREFVKRGCPVIPVIFKKCQEEPELPVFLRGMTWVDLRKGSLKDGVDRLVWGITGEKAGKD